MLQRKPVKDTEINNKTTIEQLSKHYLESGGFVAKKIGTAVEIMKEIFTEESVKFLSFPACIIATGTRGIIKELVKQKKFNILITTCGTLDHDFARTWKDYYHGSFEESDIELHKQNIHRLGNVVIPAPNYGEIIEDKLQPILKEMYEAGLRELSTYEFVWELGKRMDAPNKENSIIYWCYKNQIPMLIPGITDGAFGLQLTMFMQTHKDFKIDIFKDENYLLHKMFGDFKSSALMIGGGISKHHVIWWNQFKGGLDKAVYITTAPEWDGSLSGARVKEGISWGKVKENAKFVTVEGDATVILPLIIGPFLK